MNLKTWRKQKKERKKKAMAEIPQQIYLSGNEIKETKESKMD